jgi:hypothetical protein
MRITTGYKNYLWNEWFTTNMSLEEFHEYQGIEMPLKKIKNCLTRNWLYSKGEQNEN